MPNAIVEVRDPVTGRFAPGHTPAGRPKGFAGVAKMIMRETRDGAELVEWALCVWRDPTIDIKDRAAAFSWLSDRGLGKPVQMTELGPPGSFTDDDDRCAEGYTLDELRELEAIEARRIARLRDQNPKALDGDQKLLAQTVAIARSNPDEE